MVTESRTAIDFAHVVKDLCDNKYPMEEKSILVTDTLNIHTPASFYNAFAPEEAHRLAKRIEWHYTPKNERRLDIAEIEISVMCRQVLAKPFPDLASFRNAVFSWTQRRNSESHTIHWQFSTGVARIMLKKLYPVL